MDASTDDLSRDCSLQPCVCASTGGLVDTVIEGKTGFHMGRLSVDVRLFISFLLGFQYYSVDSGNLYAYVNGVMNNSNKSMFRPSHPV